MAWQPGHLRTKANTGNAFSLPGPALSTAKCLETMSTQLLINYPEFP